MFARCHALLAPGGGLFISDFCRNSTSSEFDTYTAASGYDLKSIDAYVRISAAAGFRLVEHGDVSRVAEAQLVDDLQHYQARRAVGDPSIDEADADHIVERWQRKIRYMQSGWLTQGVFAAEKI